MENPTFVRPRERTSRITFVYTSVRAGVPYQNRMRDSDGPLLKSFATDRSEEAFRLLTKRHLGLIFHTALRRTENRPLAGEISRNVSLAMARKSGSGFVAAILLAFLLEAMRPAVPKDHSS